MSADSFPVQFEETGQVNSGKIHTKCASPTRLSHELKSLLGESDFTVQVISLASLKRVAKVYISVDETQYLLYQFNDKI